MLSTSGLWPPEIDMAETMGGNQLYMTVHYSKGDQPHLLDGSDVEIPGLTDDFHIFHLFAFLHILHIPFQLFSMYLCSFALNEYLHLVQMVDTAILKL